MNLIIQHKDHSHDDHSCEDEKVSQSFEYPWNIYSSNSIDINAIDTIHFNTLLLSLNARPDSEMRWLESATIANIACDRSLNILWSLDFGLFTSRFETLDDEGLFLSYKLAIDHFLNEIYSKYKERTLGIILYEGQLNFLTYPAIEQAVIEHIDTHKITLQPFAKKIMARDFAIDYINQLASHLPEELQSFLILKQGSLSNYETAVLTSKESFSLHNIILDSQLLAPCVDAIGVNSNSPKGFVSDQPPLYNLQECKIGILLPNVEALLQREIQSFFPVDYFLNRNISFKIISEMFLTHDWNNIDYLIVDSSFINPQSRRKLLGFIAAGGVIVFSGESLGLANELTWENFLQTI